ncbi:replicative helicase loader/inhibitor [Neobacillus cucumis]|uniref:replicative helicase loader/inhibitor n=1 Tax=Neobacillus cucumis TaxID=1740721 RepID=UPI00203D10B7|nr:replicative helicase loader/inhibitor [Neobacillus cucumis]MCM3724678.1 replicative helicase loader/inhibitor [Neobacillus cucumis]
MTKKEAVKLLTLIESVYSHFLVKDETVLLWFQFCSEMDYEQVMAKLIKHIRKSPFPPAFTDIAVFPCEETHFPATLQEWMKKRRDRIEREGNQPKQIPIPEWHVEYSTRKSI